MQDNSEYLDIINSNLFKNNLYILNNSLYQVLQQRNLRITLFGNLFYDHDVLNFHQLDLNPILEEKRIRFAKAAKMSTKMFEIGINGGHSSLLALCANPNLEVYANDIVFGGFSHFHPEVYVPEAAKTLEQLFPTKFHSIFGNCLVEVPRFVSSHPNIEIDMIHIDGGKETYRQDFFNLLPVIKRGGLVVIDDTNQPQIQDLANELVTLGYVERIPEFPLMNPNIIYRNEILRATGKKN
jgi:hypothetical protein